MGKASGNRIILIGFSTTGKSRVGQEVAKRLGWDQVDTDDETMRRAGKSIEHIFAEDGEEHFREIERKVLIWSCGKERVVISAGGGAIIDPRNRELMKAGGFVVCLEAAPETIHQRLLTDVKSSQPLRPLLNAPDHLQRIIDLKEQRRPYYAIADWTVHTDNLTLEEVSQEVLRGWHYWKRALPGSNAHGGTDSLAGEVITGTEHYRVLVGWELLYKLGEEVKRAGLSGTAFIISDETVFFIYGGRVTKSLEDTGFTVHSFTVPPGETNKSLDTATRIYDWLVEHRAERGDLIIAFGGGVIGDLAGFVAATFLRGLPLVQIPTSLVAMVDASIGGKTGVNHPQAKNLIGAFYQPKLVVGDVQALTTLPRRELVSGWAEVIKHGLILDADFFAFLERNAGRLARMEPDIMTKAIRHSVAIKARIVSEDERERGRRTILNYGHTIGHGLEAATNYQRFLHGEAVAIGMVGEARLSHDLGLLPWEAVERQSALLEKLGLPTSCPGVELAAIQRAMELDKKVREKAIRWVLLTDIGQAVIRNDVPPEQVARILEGLLSPSGGSRR
ncbi:MAG: 3-dehydroquinate synthase [Chloroflexi bacterium]|nr:3-dehydroquinate synthase [Chloroflexota bacterium]